jgi:hypothetical protein
LFVKYVYCLFVKYVYCLFVKYVYCLFVKYVYCLFVKYVYYLPGQITPRPPFVLSGTVVTESNGYVYCVMWIEVLEFVVLKNSRLKF